MTTQSSKGMSREELKEKLFDVIDNSYGRDRHSVNSKNAMTEIMAAIDYYTSTQINAVLDAVEEAGPIDFDWPAWKDSRWAGHNRCSEKWRAILKKHKR